MSGGHGFCGIGRKRLLGLLQERARELGVQQAFQHEVEDEAAFADADLIVAADGVNSRTRAPPRGVFEPDIDVRKCRFIWLGTTQPFAAFTFAFEQTEHGWFQIHAYQFSADLSTVIVETREETWRAHGLDGCNTAQSIAFCERLFARYLDGHRLQSNANHLRGSAWLNFNRVLCQRWHHGKHRAHRRCRPHRALLHRLRHQARHGGCDLRCTQHVTAPRRRSSAALGAYQRERHVEVAEAAERRPQPHGVVRERRALRAPAAASSSPTAC